jgi:hypothetical protein
LKACAREPAPISPTVNFDPQRPEARNDRAAQQRVGKYGQEHGYRHPRRAEIAWKAQLRLTKRFQKLSKQGKPLPVVVTAIARELLWAKGRKVRPAPS